MILEANASEENPAKTTEWIAPILAQASMEATAIGETGKYMTTLSPALTPWSRRTFPNLQTRS